MSGSSPCHFIMLPSADPPSIFPGRVPQWSVSQIFAGRAAMRLLMTRPCTTGPKRAPKVSLLRPGSTHLNFPLSSDSSFSLMCAPALPTIADILGTKFS